MCVRCVRRRVATHASAHDVCRRMAYFFLMAVKCLYMQHKSKRKEKRQMVNSKDFIKQVASQIASLESVNFKKDVEKTASGYVVRTYKPVQGTIDRVCYSTEILMDKYAEKVVVIQRRTFENTAHPIAHVEEYFPDLFVIGDLELSASELHMHAVDRFFTYRKYRQKILAEMSTEWNATEKNAVVEHVLCEVPFDLSEAVIEYDSNGIYIVHHRGSDDEKVVYTTNIWQAGSHICIKTWRAFDVVYCDTWNQAPWKSFEYSEARVKANDTDWSQLCDTVMQNSA